MSEVLVLGRFAAVLLREGDRYGREGACIIPPGGKPQVEFWDLKYPHDPIAPGSGERGQFTGARYYAETLMESRTRSLELWLDAGVPEWRVSATDMNLVLEWLEDQVAGH